MRHRLLLLIVGLIAASPPAFAESPTVCKMAMAAEQADALLRRADLATSKNDYRRADDLLARGVAELHDYCLASPTPLTLDDSGMHLVLADDADQRGDPKLAATIRRGVLVGRLELFRRFHQGG